MRVESTDRAPGARSPRRVKYFTTGESRTRQEFKEECDINNIMRKYKQSGLVEHVKEYGGRYGD